MPGPFASFAFKALNLSPLSSVPKELARFMPNNLLPDSTGLLQVQFSTENANMLLVEITVNDKLALTYGPSNTNMTRIFQGIIPEDAIVNSNWSIIKGRVVSGSGFFTVRNVVMWWQGY